MSFNKAQQEAIEQKQGPFMVLAAPGSGKTLVITEHTRYLIEQAGVNPANILVITFTKAAAMEMRERFDRLMETSTQVTFGTFHAVFFQILRHAYHYTAANIIREDVKRQYIKELVEKEDMELNDEADFIAEIVSEISYVKGEMISLDSYYSTNCSDEVFRRIYQGYVTRCQRENLIDFDDMQTYCYELLSQRPDILAMWQRKFRYILIDEFQDINQVQYSIIKMLALPENNLFIVGDDDQSIYHFRGARPEIMLGFTDDYKDARSVMLGINYRSSKEIVEMAERLISNNTKRYQKEITSHQGEMEPVQIHRLPTQRDENMDIIKKIQEYNRAGMLYSEMAVLFRTNHQPRLLSEKLMEYNIPFQMKDGIFNLYEHWIAKNIIAYIRLALGDRSRTNFLTIMNRPNRYISRQIVDQPEVDFERMKMLVASKDWMVERIENFTAQLSIMPRMTPYAAINYIRKGIGYDDFLVTYANERHLNLEEMMELLDELQEGAKEYQTYDEWFQHIEEYKEQLNEVRKQDKNRDAVMLATMHGSKGLEFETVFIMDACEGVTPHKKAVKESDLEEERRMFYVAMTRAKKHLHMYVVQKIFNKKMEPSRFISEAEVDRREFVPGAMVMHDKFGEGQITYADAKRVSVFFPKQKDTKTFHIEYAVGNGYLHLQ